MKQSVVTPLYKKGDKYIALVIIDQKCVYKYIYNYPNRNGLIYEKQSGFLKGHSITRHLLDIYHQIVTSIDSKQNVCMVFCDISKAFYRVWHKGILYVALFCTE